MLAATMGGIAINHSGVAAPHGFAMTFGGLYNTTHAHGVGICLPYSIQKAIPKVSAKFSFLANYLGWSNSDDHTKNGQVIVEKVNTFFDSIKFPRKLSSMGIKKEDLPKIVARVYGDEDLANDPGSYETKEEIEDFLLKII